MNAEADTRCADADRHLPTSQMRKLSPHIPAALRSCPAADRAAFRAGRAAAPEARATAKRLRPSVLKIGDLSGTDRRRMYAIYEAHYDATSWQRFEADLDGKFCAVLVRDGTGEIRGFSTIAIFETSFRQALRRAMYSGDTIIDRAYWGSPQLALTWIRLAGHVKALAPDIPLYWFVIVKGHRTFRLLSAFSETFYPHWAYETPRPVRELMDHLGIALFPEHYRRDLGIIRFPQSHGHLKPALAEIPPAAARRADVAFFLERNPGYAAGDELLCLTELRADNLQPIARKHFLQGYRR